MSAARAKAAADASAQASEAAAAPAPKRTPRPETHQPWKAKTTRGFIPRSRTPRKVGGS
ncbi:MAG TPA: hypothetical protein VFK20_08295 [Vicinamibacterales bacterium]|nr:hypothetical protein [Vicinamibacterales bacterium]